MNSYPGATSFARTGYSAAAHGATCAAAIFFSSLSVKTMPPQRLGPLSKASGLGGPRLLRGFRCGQVRVALS
jgi:hypothetical protein